VNFDSAIHFMLTELSFLRTFDIISKCDVYQTCRGTCCLYL